MPLYKSLDGQHPNILFIHIPKTGGTSIEQYIRSKNKYEEHLYSENASYWKNTKTSVSNFAPQHLPLNLILQHQTKLFENINLNSCLVFSVCRNPYDRFLSWIFWQFDVDLTKIKTQLDQIIQTTFEKFDVSQPFEKFKQENFTDTHLEHLFPQYRFLSVSKKDTNCPFSDVIVVKQETLNQSLRNVFPSIFNTFDFNANISRIKSVSKKRIKSRVNLLLHGCEYVDFLSNNAIKTLNCIYEKDFEVFNYKQLDFKDQKNRKKYKYMHDSNFKVEIALHNFDHLRVC